MISFAHSLCSYKSSENSSSSSSKWKIPEKKRWININYEIPNITPKQIMWRILHAPFSSYFKWIGGIAVMGCVGFGVQFFYCQYRLRTSDFSLLAMKTLDNYPQLLDILGCPLKSGHVYPYVKNGIQDDEVRACIPLTGENSKGVLSFHAVKDQNIWIIRSMKFTFVDRAGGAVRLIKDPEEDSHLIDT